MATTCTAPLQETREQHAETQEPPFADLQGLGEVNHGMGEALPPACTQEAGIARKTKSIRRPLTQADSESAVSDDFCPVIPTESILQ